jgi:transcriptional regulator of arginine metabolism
MSKAERQKAILKIIRTTRIATQHELREALLKKFDVECDQATMSRDMKEIGLVRLSDAEGNYYALLNGAPTEPQPTTERMLLGRLVLSVQYSGNLVVIHTDAANAHPVAEALDRLGIPDIIGTVAGDNTILAVVREGAKAKKVADRILKEAGKA